MDYKWRGWRERWSCDPGHPSYQVQGLRPDLAVQGCGERVGCAGGTEPGGWGIREVRNEGPVRGVWWVEQGRVRAYSLLTGSR